MNDIRVIDPPGRDYWRAGTWRRHRDYRNWHPWTAVLYWRVWRSGRLNARILWRMWWSEWGWPAKMLARAKTPKEDA